MNYNKEAGALNNATTINGMAAEVRIGDDGTVEVINPRTALQSQKAYYKIGALLSADAINASRREYKVGILIPEVYSRIKTDYIRVNFDYGDGTSGQISYVFGPGNYHDFAEQEWEATGTHIYSAAGVYQLVIKSYLITVFESDGRPMTEGTDYSWNFQSYPFTVK